MCVGSKGKRVSVEGGGGMEEGKRVEEWEVREGRGDKRGTYTVVRFLSWLVEDVIRSDHIIHYIALGYLVEGQWRSLQIHNNDNKIRGREIILIML